MKRPDWDTYFMTIAWTVRMRSHDHQTQVGAVIVDPRRRIISTGYNGFPPGADDKTLPNTRPGKYPYIVHAETNAIATATRSCEGATIYSTLLPCPSCTGTLITAGIKRVVYHDVGNLSVADQDATLTMLDQCGVMLDHASPAADIATRETLQRRLAYALRSIELLARRVT